LTILIIRIILIILTILTILIIRTIFSCSHRNRMSYPNPLRQSIDSLDNVTSPQILASVNRKIYHFFNAIPKGEVCIFDRAASRHSSHLVASRLISCHLISHRLAWHHLTSPPLTRMSAQANFLPRSHHCSETTRFCLSFSWQKFRYWSKCEMWNVKCDFSNGKLNLISGEKSRSSFVWVQIKELINQSMNESINQWIHQSINNYDKYFIHQNSIFLAPLHRRRWPKWHHWS
jgi:hypothetical protein